MPFGTRRFNFGVNIGWLDSLTLRSGPHNAANALGVYEGAYDHDLGINQFHPTWPVAFDGELLDAYFNHMHHCGIKVVRFWAFEWLEGLRFDTSPQNGSVVGLDATFEANVQAVMRSASAHGLELYWCLLSGKADQSIPQNYTLRNLISRPALREAFITHALDPFLELITRDEYRASIFAIDLINEPEGLRLNPNGRYLWDYIRDGARQVHRFALLNNVDLRCSVGFKDPNTIRSHRNDITEHLDFYDFHAYNSHGDLDRYSAQNFDKPCIIGEFGHKDEDDDDSSVPSSVGDNRQRNTDLSFMTNAFDDGISGYAGCLAWRYSPTGDHHHLLQDRKPEGSSTPFKESFLSAAGHNPTLSMDDPDWKARHERPVWRAIRDFVNHYGPFV